MRKDPARAAITTDLDTGVGELFDLQADLAERNDLAAAQPERVAAMKDRLTGYLKAVHAAMPRANPDFDPAKAPATKKARGGRRNQPAGRPE
jgi:arylsulfatase A-like enzyme